MRARLALAPLLLLPVAGFALQGDATCTGVAPVNRDRPRISEPTFVGDLVTAGTGTWQSCRPIIGYAYQWYRESTESREWQTGLYDPIPGATGERYVLAEADEGRIEYVLVTAHTGDASTSIRSEPIQVASPGDQPGEAADDQWAPMVREP